MPNAASQSAEQGEERKQRKKLQNRLNQRARRLRIREQESLSKTSNKRPYQIDRWRLDNEEPANTLRYPSSTRSIDLYDPQTSLQYGSKNQERSLHVVSTRGRDASRGDSFVRANALDPSPLQDHLLNLIQFNVLRGLFSNKDSLIKLARYFAVDSQPGNQKIPYHEQVYPPRAVIVPTSRGLPESLHPTQLQITVEHLTWIDLIPFPKMRDNLIRQESQYDHVDLVEDIIGDLLDVTIMYGPHTSPRTQHGKNHTSSHYYGDEYDTVRKGFIVWGQPHCPESWEVTPSFLRKWWWALEGCQQLIESTNRWRLVRGERPLVAAL